MTIRDHSLTRREFVAASAGMAAAGLVTARGRGPGGARDAVVYVGTYTEGVRRQGVHRLRMDATRGTLRADGAFDVGADPSFLALHPNGRVLYAVSEVGDYEGRQSGSVAAFAVGGAGVTPLGARRATGGGAPCYVSVDRGGRHAFVANYGGGSVAVLPIAAGGGLGEATHVVQHEGHGPNAERQEGPHAHCAIPDPSGRYVLAADLGLDRVMVYRLDGRAGTLVPAATPFAALPPGAGPRHLAFHPNGRFLYVTCEMGLVLAAFRWSADAGTLTSIGTAPLLDAPAAGEATAADVHVAPSGRFVYASVRGPDVVTVLAIDPATGAPSPVQRVPTGGHWPRNFALDPSGRFLLVANQHSNDITGFDVDRETGRLTPNAVRIEIPAPVCVRFA